MVESPRPTSIRWIILALTVVVAVLLYLDRYCLGFVLPFVRAEYRLTDSQANFLIGAFFYTYAFGQIAGGYLSDRFGTRLSLSVYLFIWSILTGVTGFATGFLSLVILRFGCGLFEAGAYPACAGMIRRWFPYERRGLASGFISIGGRVGGTVAPLMTSYLMIAFDSWQPVLMIYGTAGVFMAFVYFGFFRDTPRQHFLANEQEADLVESHEKLANEPPAATGSALWFGIVTSPGLWASSVVQFGTNFGWIFLGSMMPTYLARVFPQVSLVERGWMAMLPFLAAVPVMILGGWWTDRMSKGYGGYWGRCFPIASTRFVAAFAFLACTFLDSPWTITIVLSAFSVASDVGLPAIWAYNLDVGKRNVGLVLGWGNMWGNLGAAVAPSVLGDLVLKRFVNFDGTFTTDDAKIGYNAVFLTCAAVFVFIGFVSFMIDATKPIGEKSPPPLTA